MRSLPASLIPNAGLETDADVDVNVNGSHAFSVNSVYFVCVTADYNAASMSRVYVNGTQVDAMRTKLPTSTLLAGSNKTKFRALVAEAQGKWDKAWDRIQLASR